MTVTNRVLPWCVALLAGALAACGGAGPSSSGRAGPSVKTLAQPLASSLTTSALCDALPPSNAVYLFVSGASGNNATAVAGDRTSPYATIAGAFAAVPSTLASPYVIEILDSGTYAESLSLTGRTTSSTNRLTLRTAVGATPTLSGSGSAPVVTIGMSNVGLVGLTLAGSTSQDGVSISGATSNTQLLCNVIRNNARGLNVASGVQTSLLIEGNRITNNNSSGISFTTGGAGFILRRNVIAFNGVTNASTGPGVDLTASSPQIINNTFYNNALGTTAIANNPDLRINGAAAAAILRNNVFSSNASGTKAALRIEANGSISTSSQSNTYYYPNVTRSPATCDPLYVGNTCHCFAGCSGASWQTVTGADNTGPSEADPLFADAANGDFHERSAGGRWTSTGWVVDATSSTGVIDNGTIDSADAEPEPNGNVVNRGAYGGGPQASKRAVGYHAVIIPVAATFTAPSTSVTVTVQIRTSAGTVVNAPSNYAPTMTVTSPNGGTTNTNIRIQPSRSEDTFTLTSTSAQEVTVSLPSEGSGGNTVGDTSAKIVFLPAAPEEVTSLVALSGNGQNRLTWTNPARHDGVVILRSTGAAPSTAPTCGTTCAVGATVGNATIVYVDSQSYANQMTDRGLSNGTRYYYRVFNRDAYGLFSPGQVPSLTGIVSDATGGGTSPKWCYNVGLTTLQQPYIQFGTAVYTSSNARAVTGNTIAIGSFNDGFERWRPSTTTGLVQARPTVVPLFGRSGNFIITGDQDGYAYGVDAQTGQQIWVGNGGAPLTAGMTLQAQPAVQVAALANAAFTTAHPNRDLAYFATSGSSTTGNKIHALSSVDGSIVWSYPPNGTSMDIVSGGLMIDYPTNRLWVGSRGGSGGTQGALWIVDVLTGTEARAPYVLGDIDAAVVRNPINNQAYVVTTAGVAYGFDLTTMNQLWTYNIGAPVRGYLVPVGNGFIASTATGVQRYVIGNAPTYTVTPMWPNTTSPTPTALNGPSAGRIDFGTNNKVYVSDSQGRIHKLNLTTGANEGNVTVSSGVLGMPALDTSTTPHRLYVGGVDGRLCAIDVF